MTEIEELSGAPLGHGMKTRDRLGQQYSLGKTTVARYLRINELIPALKNQLDRNMIGMRVAESLSFLKLTEQEIVCELLTNGQKINVKQAEELKEKSINRELDKIIIEEILNLNRIVTTVKPIKLDEHFLLKYFKADQSTEEIESIISKALEQYLRTKPIDI